MTETETPPIGEDRWQQDPIRGLRTAERDGRWQSRVAMLNHLKAVYSELADEDDDKGLVAQIDTALERLRDGVYDRCTNCGRRIQEDVVRFPSWGITTCTSYHRNGSCDPA